MSSGIRHANVTLRNERTHACTSIRTREREPSHANASAVWTPRGADTCGHFSSSMLCSGPWTERNGSLLTEAGTTHSAGLIAGWPCQCRCEADEHWQGAGHCALENSDEGVALALRGKKSVVLKTRLERDAADDDDAAAGVTERAPFCLRIGHILRVGETDGAAQARRFDSRSRPPAFRQCRRHGDS